jgi:hypothetical protein
LNDAKPIRGYGLADSVEILGDDIARIATWNGGADVGAAALPTSRC